MLRCSAVSSARHWVGLAAAGLMAVTGAVYPDPVTGQNAPDTIEIYTVHDSDEEREVLGELREVIRGLDLRDWVVTRTVRIDQTQIPHSHPVLTIHVGDSGNSDALLATFLHEQFHWWIEGHQDQLDAAVAQLREIFPDVPVGNSEGARSEYSTYLHLVICHLERQAMELLRGPETARRVLASNRHYTWIYDRVLTDKRVEEVLAQVGLVLS